MLREAGFKSFADVEPGKLRSMFISAAEEVYAEAEKRLSEGECVCLETVLSTDKFRPLVERLIASGGRFNLIYVAVSSADVSKSRVVHRASLGGHDVPPDKVADRWLRSMHRVGWFARRAHVFIAFDNTDAVAETPPSIIARAYKGKVQYLDESAVSPFVLSIREAFADSEKQEPSR